MAAFVDGYDGNTNIEAYTRGFERVYEGARKGLSFNQVVYAGNGQVNIAASVLSAEARQAAYNAGVESLRGEYNGETGENVSGRSGERNDGERAGEQNGRMAGGTKEAQGGRSRNGETAAGARKGSEGAANVSARSLGINNGTDRAEARILTYDEVKKNKDLYKVYKRAAKDGVTVQFFEGSLYFDEGNGEFETRGVYENGKAWVRADHPKYTAEQIYRHEYAHHLKQTTKGFMAQLKAALEYLGDEQITALANEYSKAFIGAVVVDENGNINKAARDYALEEMYCDSYAGMNGFDGRFGTDVQQAFAITASEEVSGIAEKARANETRGSPEGETSFSLDGWGRGYDGYSMSNNARAAYEDGQMPMSKWTKTALLDRVNAIDPAKADLLRNVNAETIREHLLEYIAWHHTSSQYNRTDFYGINEETVKNLTAEEVSSWERVTKKPTAKDSFRGDINYIEWTGTQKHPKANPRVLTDVNIQEKGSFYIVTDDNGNVLLRKKIGSNGTSVVNYAEEARRKEAMRQREENRIRNSTEAANELYAKLKKNGYESSYSGNIYARGRKPSSYDYSLGIEKFFKDGEQRLSPNNDGGYYVETFHDGKWVAEDNNSKTSFSIESPVPAIQEARSSRQYDGKYMDNAEEYNRTHGMKVSAEVMEAARKVRERIAKRMESQKYEMALPEDVTGNTAVGNSAYGFSEENSTECIRSIMADEFVDAVAEDLGRPVTQEEAIYISQEAAAFTNTPQCLYCYVAMDRAAFRDFLGKYIKQMNETVAKLGEGKTDEQLYKEFLGKRKATKEMRARFDMWINTVRNAGEMLTEADLASEANMRKAVERNPELAALVNDAKKYAQSASWAKKRVPYKAYNGHILKWSDSRIKTLNRMFGLRMYSFSDYSPAFVLENMQMITDAAARGLKVLAYTKELDFVRVFAKTDANINISTFGYMQNGQVGMNAMHGADWKEAQKLRAKYDNVGITFVATSDALVEWALAQDWIDVVIPFHMVRTGQVVADALKYTNYTSDSHDGKLLSSAWFTSQ